MTARSIKHVGFFALVVAVTTMAVPGTSRADFNVAQGWDLFQTVSPGSNFTGLGQLMGVPLSTFDFDNAFGRGIGVRGVSPTDTIVQRLDNVIVSGVGQTGTTNLVMNALQLETVAPVNFAGLGLDNYFVTLQSVRGGQATVGSMAITFLTGQSGTFASSLDVFFDIRKGSLGGAIVFSSDLVLTSSGTAWRSTPPTPALEITGVNRFLSGINGDRSRDFWVDEFNEQKPSGDIHRVREAPEPASIVLLGIGALGLGAYGWRRRRAA